MIEMLKDLPDGVIGFEAVGEVHSDDYRDVLVPVIEAASGDGIRLVYVLGDRFEGYSAGASWQDGKLGREHLRGWKRIAVVSDHEGLRHLVHAFAWMIPGELQTYRLAQRDEAIAWAGGG